MNLHALFTADARRTRHAWHDWRTTPLPDVSMWGPLEHALPTRFHVCKLCDVRLPEAAFTPSELRGRRKIGRRGQESVLPAQLRCRACVRIRARRWYRRSGAWRKYASEVRG